MAAASDAARDRRLAELAVFFNPRSIAIVGASSTPTTIPGRPLKILQQHGYVGRLYPVNPKYRELRGLPCYPDIGAVPEPVDLALVAVPAAAVPGVLEACAAAGVRHAMVFSSGFAEADAAGRELQHRIRGLVGRTPMRIAGPNCEGYFNLTGRVPAGFSPTIDPDRAYRPSEPGPIAVVAQSGGLGFSLFNRGLEAGLGFSTAISTGNEVDLETLDYLEYLVEDPATRVILAFVESFRSARRLIEVGRRAAELAKPIVVAKIGRSEAGRRAAASHTGSLVGTDEVYDAALRQLGMLRVDDVEEMLDAAAYLSSGRLPKGRRLAILTASGGGGAWLADACAMNRLELPELEPALQAELRPLLPSYGATSNPIDVTAQAVAHPGGLDRVLAILTRSARLDALAMIVPLASPEIFEGILPGLRGALDASELSFLHYSYTTPKPSAVATLKELGIPCFTSPMRAARALHWACRYREFLDRRGEVGVWGAAAAPPLPAPPARPTEHDARAWLAPCEIPSPADGLARSADEAAALFRRLGGPVALKVQSPELPHKTDFGGVRLGLADEAAVRAAYAELEAAARAARPDATLAGILVQAMAPAGVELILGARLDPDCGPVVLVGLGGIQVELYGDVTLRLAPVSPAEARAMLAELRGAPLLGGLRGRPPADLEALVGAIVRFSELAARLPAEVAAVEINPLLALPPGDGVLMLDAAIEMLETNGE